MTGQTPAPRLKKVTAFVGTASKKHTLYAVRQFLSGLESQGDVETETVVLSDYRLGNCRGCKICFMKGEEFCALKDDRDVLIEKMTMSDGVVLATPNYSFHVSGVMKTFLDRLGFMFHRPRFFGKVFTSIVVQGFYGGSKIMSYLDFVGNGLGFNTVKGSCMTALDPMTEKEQRKLDGIIAAHGRRFYKRMSQASYPSPSLMKLLIFRMGRTNVRLLSEKTSPDYAYYRDKGWLESDYNYPVRLNVVKKAAGGVFDFVFSRMAKR
jgi:multimeric flavodoxin WrbA